MMGCIADYYCALRWVEDNASKIDELPDLEATQRMCCSTFTPLDMAVIAKRRDLVEKLIAKGACTDNLEFMLEFMGWEVEDTRALLSQRVNKWPGFDALSKAIQRHDARRLEQLLDHGGEPNSQQTWNGWDGETHVQTLLEIAVTDSTLECVKLLVQRGAIIRTEVIPKAFLRFHDAYAVVLLLLSAGAVLPVGVPDQWNETILWNVCSGLYQGKDRAALVAILIEQGADVNVTRADTKTTPLMFVAASGNLDVISLLLGAGADPLARDQEGRAAIDFARLRGKTRAVETLLQAEAQYRDDLRSDSN